MLIKEFSLKIPQAENNNFFIKLENDRGNNFGLVKVKDSKAVFTLIDFDTELFNEERLHFKNPLRVPITKFVHVYLYKYLENGAIIHDSNLNEIDECYCVIPFNSERHRKFCVYIPDLGLWPFYKFRLALCFAQNCNINHFLHKFAKIKPYKAGGHKEFFLETFQLMAHLFFIDYKNDTTILKNTNRDMWDMNAESSKTGDCEDFSGFFLHIFHTLKNFWDFIHEKLLKVKHVPYNICNLYEAYFSICSIDDEGHCKLVLKTIGSEEMLTFEATNLEAEKFHEYQYYILVNSLDIRLPPGEQNKLA